MEQLHVCQSDRRRHCHMGNALHSDNVQVDQDIKQVDVHCRPLSDGEGGRPGAAGEGSAACR